DQVVVHRDVSGRVSVAPTAVQPRVSPLLLYTAHGSWYAVPSIATPFLGRQLDVRLFDTSLSPAQRARVQVHWHGATAPAMPWLTAATTIRPGLTVGTVTASSGLRLRTALAQQSP